MLHTVSQQPMVGSLLGNKRRPTRKPAAAGSAKNAFMAAATWFHLLLSLMDPESSIITNMVSWPRLAADELCAQAASGFTTPPSVIPLLAPVPLPLAPLPVMMLPLPPIPTNSEPPEPLLPSTCDGFSLPEHAASSATVASTDRIRLVLMRSASKITIKPDQSSPPTA